MDGERARRLLDRVLAGVPAGESPLTHVEVLPAQAARTVPWPLWASPPLVAALYECGIPAPWSHQLAAADAAWRGEHVVIATGTASGKSLAYQLPVLTTLVEQPRATALYLSPTKALAADQLRSVSALLAHGEGAPSRSRDMYVPSAVLTSVRPAALDGDTPLAERDWVRAHARWVFTNPDMMHRSILPGHARWSHWLRRLRYVVVDECHGYRGVFGSQVALLLRRLHRVASHYGASPVFVLASATAFDPAASASALTGLPVTAVTEDGSPRGSRTVALWEPPLTDLAGENGAPVRRAAGTEAGRILADLVIEGARAIAFVRSRRGAELTSLGARRILSEVDGSLDRRVAAYRAGYLPEERRALEEALSTGELLGVASTNALELGVDIAGLDAVVVAGYPGTVASFWQQAGRAGRAGASALVIFVARDDPLDTYLVHHPSALLGRPVESCVLDPANPYVLEPQLACAAAELPLTEADVATTDGLFGDSAKTPLDTLVSSGLLRRRPKGWYWSRPRERPHSTVDIRGSGGEQVAIVEADTGRMLGTVDPGSAHTQTYPGAVYLHQGSSYVVDELDLDNALALVHAEEPHWTTSARSVVDISVAGVIDSARYGQVEVALGEVEVTSQVVGYLRRLPSGEVLDHVPLDLPPRRLGTRAVWYTLSDALLATAGVDLASVPGALHAAEHAAIGLLPLFATCDRWDIGGVSTAAHPDTGRPTVFVHDGHPGGAGFADRGFAALAPWLTATREAIASCECPAGCPSCVQSPKCGNSNQPLDKAGAVLVLDAVLTELASQPPR